MKIELEISEMFGDDDWTCVSTEWEKESGEAIGSGSTPSFAASDWVRRNTQYINIKAKDNELESP